MFSIYIWIRLSEIVINCTQAGCISTSMAHFNYLVGVGAIEMVFELAGIVKIFYRKHDIENGKNHKEEQK